MLASSSIRIKARGSQRLLNPTTLARKPIPIRIPRRSNHSYPEHEYPFKPPPISTRLRPLIPFFIYWCAITSLAVHLLRTRTTSKEELDKAQAQISVLSGLIHRFKKREIVGEDEMRRELEMVGLRERVLTAPEEGRDVGWFKAIFGRKGVRDDKEVEEDDVVDWAKGRFILLHRHSCPTLRMLMIQWSMKPPQQIVRSRHLVHQNV